jgi:hypothetical protein
LTAFGAARTPLTPGAWRARSRRWCRRCSGVLCRGFRWYCGTHALRALSSSPCVRFAGSAVGTFLVTDEIDGAWFAFGSSSFTNVTCWAYGALAVLGYVALNLSEGIFPCRAVQQIADRMGGCLNLVRCVVLSTRAMRNRGWLRGWVRRRVLCRVCGGVRGRVCGRVCGRIRCRV